jgi:DNA ligase (NAD+)
METNENNLIQQAYGTDQQSLKNFLGQLADTYYNAVQLVSDATYDKLFDIYEQRFGEYTQIGSAPRGEKEALTIYRSGMRKVTKEDQLRNYMKNYPGEWLLLDKINGVNLQYTLIISPSGMRSEKLTTRGDGTEGKNVTHLLPYLNIPKLEFDLDVIGELYTSTEAFNRLGHSFGYTSALGMTVGIVNRKDSFNPEEAKELRFAPFEIVKSTETPEVQIIQLTMIGFEPPYAIKANELTMKFLEKFYQERLAAAKYDMDGIVIRQNRYVVPSTVNEKPRHIVAFKMDGISIETTVTEVVWVASKNKLLKPAIHYLPVNWNDGEATLQSTNGDNARYIVNNGIGPGAKIMITRAKGIIPRITSVLQRVEPSLPDPNVHGQYEWNANQVEFVLWNDNDQIRAAKVESFFIKLKIEHLGPARVKSLIQAGYPSILDIMLATPEQLAIILGPNVGPTAYYDMHAKAQNVPLHILMAASGVFPNIGKTLFKLLIDTHPELYLWWKSDPNQIAQAFLQVKGFSDSRASTVANLMSTFGDWLIQHPMITFAIPHEAIPAFTVSPNTEIGGTLLTVIHNVPTIPQNLAGKSIVFSGPRHHDVEAVVESRGGKITSAVSKNTSYLVLGDSQSTTGKYVKAQSLGVPIFVVDEFKRQFFI